MNISVNLHLCLNLFNVLFYICAENGVNSQEKTRNHPLSFVSF